MALLRHFQEGGLGGGGFFGAKAPEKDNFTKNTGSSYYNKTFQGVFWFTLITTKKVSYESHEIYFQT